MDPDHDRGQVHRLYIGGVDVEEKAVLLPDQLLGHHVQLGTHHLALARNIEYGLSLNVGLWSLEPLKTIIMTTYKCFVMLT